MKQNKTYLLFIGLLATILFTSCQQDDFISSRDEINGTERTVTFSMNTLQWQQKTTTRSGGVTDMQLLCFDEYGLFVGRRQATITDLDADKEAGKMTVSIPTVTQRVHFISNGDFSNFNDTESLAKHENTVIPALSSGDGTMAYWGYKRVSSPDELTDEPITLYRNQVQISFEKNDTDIEDIAFTVSNYYANGTVAPFNTEDLGNPFGNYTIASELITIPDNPGSVQTEENDMISTGSKYIYETANSENKPVYVIFKVKYTGDGRNYYHKILLADSENFNQLPLYRNHWYKINIKYMPKSSGYDSFDKAVAGEPSNNPFITIDDILPDISSGDYTLSIIGGTSHIFQETAGVIQFRTNSGLEANELKISWVENNGVATIINQTHNPATGEGSVALQLNTTDEPQQAVLRIQAGPLVRNIKIYAVKAFTFVPASFNGTELKFNIPESYPKDLFPVECKIISDRFDAVNQLGVTVEEFVYEGNVINTKCKKYIYVAEAPGEQTVRLEPIGNHGDATTFEFYVEANYFKTEKIDFKYPFKKEDVSLSGTYTALNSTATLIFTPLVAGTYNISLPDGFEGNRAVTINASQAGQVQTITYTTPDGTKITSCEYTVSKDSYSATNTASFTGVNLTRYSYFYRGNTIINVNWNASGITSSQFTNKGTDNRALITNHTGNNNDRHYIITIYPDAKLNDSVTFTYRDGGALSGTSYSTSITIADILNKSVTSNPANTVRITL